MQTRSWPLLGKRTGKPTQSRSRRASGASPCRPMPARPGRLAPVLVAVAVVGLLLCDAANLFAAAAGSLSESARGQIEALLSEKASWTPAQNKMESQLIHALKKHRGQAFAAGAPELQLDVKLEPDGQVLVDINANVTPELLALVAQGGGKVINSFPQFHAVRALVTLAQLETLAGSQDVFSIRRADEGRTNTGSVDSEGDT